MEFSLLLHVYVRVIDEERNVVFIVKYVRSLIIDMCGLKSIRILSYCEEYDCLLDRVSVNTV
jgi:hypothetical protein